MRPRPRCDPTGKDPLGRNSAMRGSDHSSASKQPRIAVNMPLGFDRSQLFHTSSADRVGSRTGELVSLRMVSPARFYPLPNALRSWPLSPTTSLLNRGDQISRYRGIASPTTEAK